MIERPRNDNVMDFYTFLVKHGYDEKPFDYVLDQINQDIAVRYPYYVKGKIARVALEQVWGSFNALGLKRAYEIQNQQKAAAMAPVAEDDCEVPF